ncbi:MAG: MFS transporter [Cyclobacteriaceae bacterium]|nr:MFS transporter [Cyclobacteriaceae bacterium]
MAKNIKRVINAWCMYDWANSVYSLVITTTIFPIYYASVTKIAFGSEGVIFFGIPVNNTVLYSYSLSFSFLLVALISPMLSGIADFGGLRKSFMKFFTYLGGLSCIMLAWFNGFNLEFGILFSTLASIGFAGSIVFYNAYLPIISTEDKYDRLSARGFAFGYGGSVILLICSLFVISNPDLIGLKDAGMASRLTFVLVGIWWIGFAQITFYYLPEDTRFKGSLNDLMNRGYAEIVRVFVSLRLYRSTARFLLAFLFYNMGVQTVIYMAALFGDKELGLSANDLIVTILIIQIVAIAGSYLFALISEWRGNKFALLFMIFTWLGVCIFAFFIRSSLQFFILGTIVGLVLGGIQSLSRATYSKLIPTTTVSYTSYFSFYDVVEKLSVVLGTLAYGLVEQITGSMRNSTLALAIFFVLGFLTLWSVAIPFQSKPKAT